MTITEFMEKKKVTQKEMADAIGVSESIVRLWYLGASSPRLIHALKINTFSKNKVKFPEMLNNKDRVEFLNAKN